MKHTFEIKKSRIEGRGAFATQPIKKGELICRTQGDEMSISELQRKYKEGTERWTDPFQVRDLEYLDLDEPYVFINHSCDPNATVIGFNELIALKQIETGEEIIYDYSLTEWTDDKSWQGYDEWSMECRCGYSSCRKQINEFRFLPKDIQEKSVKLNLVQDHIFNKYKNAIMKH